MKRSLLVCLVLVLGACSSGSGSGGGSGGGGGGGGRSTSDARVRSFVGGQLPAAPGGGQWVRHMNTLGVGEAPKVIYYQFAFPT